MSGLGTTAIMQLLEQRNFEGMHALLKATEFDREDMAMFLMDTYPTLCLTDKCLFKGNTMMHYACQNGNIKIIQRLYDSKPELIRV